MASIEELTRERMKVAAAQPRPVNNAIPGLAVQEMPRTPPEFLQGPRAQAAAPAATRAAPGAALPPPSIAQAPAATGRLRQAATALGGKRAVLGGAALMALPEAVNVGRVAMAPGMGIGDVATQAAEGVGRTAATIAGAGVGAKWGAGLGTMVAPGIGTAIGTGIGTLAGGAAGYLGADKLIRSERGFYGVDQRSPVDRIPASAPSIATPPRAQPARPGGGVMDVQSGRGKVNPPTVGQGAAQQAAYTNPNGTITRDGNSYSGKDIKFGADIRTPTGALRNGGSVTSLDMSEGHRQNLLELQRNAAERAAQAQDPTRNRPAMQIGGTALGFRQNEGPASIADMVVSGKINAQQANAMAAAQEASQQIPIARMRSETDLATNDASNANQRSIAELNSGTNITTAKIGADSRQTAAELAAERRAQATEAAAAARVQAAEAGAKKYTVVPGGQEVIDIGGFPTTITRPARVLDNATGKAVALDGEQGAQQQPAWANDPRVMAIKNSNASMAEKRKQLEALGYR